MEWQRLDSGCRTAEENMAMDQHLLDTLDPQGPPIFHQYEWQGDSATYGYFVKPEDYLNVEVARERQLTLARRPTGGGIIFHTADLAFSVLIPAGHPAFSLNTLDNYLFVNKIVLSAVEQFCGTPLSTELLPQGAGLDCRFCMAKPTQYDVMVGGKKVGGAAQRRTKAGYLHQGSIALKMADEELLRSVLKEAAVFEAMQANSYLLLEREASIHELSTARKELQEILFQLFCDKLF